MWDSKLIHLSNPFPRSSLCHCVTHSLLLSSLHPGPTTALLYVPAATHCRVNAAPAGEQKRGGRDRLKNRVCCTNLLPHILLREEEIPQKIHIYRLQTYGWGIGEYR